MIIFTPEQRQNDGNKTNFKDQKKIRILGDFRQYQPYWLDIGKLLKKIKKNRIFENFHTLGGAFHYQFNILV